MDKANLDLLTYQLSPFIITPRAVPFTICSTLIKIRTLLAYLPDFLNALPYRPYLALCILLALPYLPYRPCFTLMALSYLPYLATLL